MYVGLFRIRQKINKKHFNLNVTIYHWINKVKYLFLLRIIKKNKHQFLLVTVAHYITSLIYMLSHTKKVTNKLGRRFEILCQIICLWKHFTHSIPFLSHFRSIVCNIITSLLLYSCLSIPIFKRLIFIIPWNWVCFKFWYCWWWYLFIRWYLLKMNVHVKDSVKRN